MVVVVGVVKCTTISLAKMERLRRDKKKEGQKKGEKER